MTASILQPLLALYFAIIYSWQVSSCEKSLAGKKKFIHTSQGFYISIFLLNRYFFSFSFRNAYLPCRLRKAYAVLGSANRFVGSETLKDNDFDQF